MRAAAYCLAALCFLTGAAGAARDAPFRGGMKLAAPRLGSIAPSGAFDAGPVKVTITGDGLYDGIVPALSQAGRKDIAACSVKVRGGTRMDCVFDLTGAATGYWNVTLPRAGKGAGILNGFKVSFPPIAVRAVPRSRPCTVGIETGQGIVTVDIPAGTFAEDCVVSLFEPLSSPGPGGPGATAAVQFVNDKSLTPQKDITMTFYCDLP